MCEKGCWNDQIHSTCLSIPEGCRLRTYRHENLKSHVFFMFGVYHLTQILYCILLIDIISSGDTA
jgi:hypothetical protein